MEKFWMILGENGKGPVVRHDSLYSASKEAERLAANNPGQKFIVLESLKYCEIKNPIIWNEVTDPVPF